MAIQKFHKKFKNLHSYVILFLFYNKISNTYILSGEIIILQVNVQYRKHLNFKLP